MTSAVEHKYGTIVKIMVACADNTSSEKLLPNVTREVNAISMTVMFVKSRKLPCWALSLSF